MKASLSSVVRLSAVALLAVTSVPGHAQVLWNWSYGGTEAGTFTTDGTFAQTATSGTFTVSNMGVTSSTIAAAVGAAMNEGNQSGNGFVWNGSAATQFFRGANNPPPVTNGSSFFTTVSGTQYRYGFAVSSGSAVGSTSYYSFPLFIPIVNGALTLTPTSTPSGVPEIDPAGMASVLSLVVGSLGIAERRLRKARRLV